MDEIELTKIPVLTDTNDDDLDRRSSLAIVPAAQWEDFEDDIVKLTKAHADCRDLNNVLDRLLRVGAMLLSFATTALVATRENTEADEVTAPTFAECVMSGGVSLLAGLNTMYDNSGQRQKHQHNVDRYRSLREKIGIARQNPRLSGHRTLYDKLRKRKIKIQTEGLSIFGHVRRRHNVL